MRVLLVCENPRISTTVTSALIGDGQATITEVRTPQRALVLIDGGEEFDLVVADNDTAPSGGYFLTREIKARGQMGRDMPPVILFLGREQDRFLSNWSQADAFIIKPVDPFDFRMVATALVTAEPVPELPGVGGDPTPSLLDIPGEEGEDALNPTAGSLPGGMG